MLWVKINDIIGLLSYTYNYIPANVNKLTQIIYNTFQNLNCVEATISNNKRLSKITIQIVILFKFLPLQDTAYSSIYKFIQQIVNCQTLETSSGGTNNGKEHFLQLWWSWHGNINCYRVFPSSCQQNVIIATLWFSFTCISLRAIIVHVTQKI